MPLDLVTIEHGPHPEVLTAPAAIVAFPLSTEDQALIKQMTDMLLALNGVGLAAPQVGVAKQILVYAISLEASSLRKNAQVVPPTVLINPQYTPTKEAQMVYDWEGCFSVNDIMGKVPRYSQIKYTAKTPDGNTIEAIANGFTARVLQHEIDHLQGKLITHRLTPDCVQGHPDDMLAVRYKEFNPAQKEIVKKMLDEREKKLNPDDKAQLQAIHNMKRMLNSD